MSGHSNKQPEANQDLSEEVATRSLLDQLLENSRLYRTSKSYKELLDFVVRLRNFAPFNAMLLQIQKPGLTYAASARDWWERFGRRPKEGARPLLILWPHGPVALVYDVQDTEGNSLPEDVWSFVAHGPIDDAALQAFQPLLKKKNIDLTWVDEGDGNAGCIKVTQRATNNKEVTQYSIKINRNHDAPVKFATLAHELGHLFLGHLGSDTKLRVTARSMLTEKQRELEAESVAYIVCARNRVQSKSHTYLSHFVDANTTIQDLDLYQVMRAAGQVETILGLTARAQFDQPATGVQRVN